MMESPHPAAPRVVAHVVVLGDVMTDIVARPRAPLAPGSDTPADIAVRAGGSAANQAAWLATMGPGVHLVGRVGADPFGEQHRAALARIGVTPHLAVDPSRPTGMIVALVDASGERGFLTERGANDGLESRHLPDDAFAPGGWLLLSGYALVSEGARPAALAALALARSRGMRVCVDPAATAPLAAVGPERFIEWTRGADLLFPNLEEARLLTGEREPEAAARALCAWYGGVALKLGAAGGLWARAGEPALLVPAEQTPVIDTTGAGDAFCAGFLGRWLRGAPPDECLAAGIRLGAVAAGRVGARPPGADFAL